MGSGVNLNVLVLEGAAARRAMWLMLWVPLPVVVFFNIAALEITARVAAGISQPRTERDRNDKAPLSRLREVATSQLLGTRRPALIGSFEARIHMFAVSQAAAPTARAMSAA